MPVVFYKIPAIAKTANGRRNPRGKIQYTLAKGERLVSFAIQYGWNGETGAYDTEGEWSCVTHLATGWKVGEFKNRYLMECVNRGDLHLNPVPVARLIVEELVTRVGAEAMLAKFDATLVING